MKNIDEYVEEEKRILDLKYKFISEFIKFRKDNNLTQQEMADNAKVLREQIAKIENNIASPQVDTLIKILEPLGYTISITKIEK